MTGQGLSTVEAYYTTSIATIERATLPKGYKLPPYPVPVLLIARLAVATNQKGQGLGKITLIRALEHLLGISELTLAVAVVVDPIDVNADAFYRHFSSPRKIGKSVHVQTGKTVHVGP